MLLLLVAISAAISSAQALTTPCGPHQRLCAATWDALSWSAAIFPNAFGFPLAFTGPPRPAFVILMLAMNGLLAAAAWRWLPPKLSLPKLALVIAGWIALSVITTLWAPELARPAYNLFH